MNKREQQAIEVLKSGGYFRRALATQWRGGEKFETHLYAANGLKVPGIGYQTKVNLESMLRSRECARSTVWTTEWVIAS